ncbi:MAG: hypothetical protein JNM84_20555 [Planctomycetes bacterium]|nr:hypothetical protein [Planctomycetota bacterium]
MTLPGTSAREAWAERYAALSIGRRSSEAVPALATLRATLQRIAVHFEALCSASGTAEPWSFAIGRMLSEPVRAIEVRLAWEPSSTELAPSALASLRVEVGWLGVRSELSREIAAAFAARGIADLDPHSERVLLPFGGEGAPAESPRLRWSAPQELWLSFGAKAPAPRAPLAIERPFDGIAIEVDLAQVEAWLSNILFGQAHVERGETRRFSLEKQLASDAVRDRWRWPSSAAPASEVRPQATLYRLASGWLRFAVAPEQREALLALAAALERWQGEDAAWVDEARSILALATRDESSNANAITGLVCAPTLARLGLRSAIWCAGFAPREDELVARGWSFEGEHWRRGPAVLRCIPRGWVIAPRLEEATAIAAALAGAEAVDLDSDWIAELEVATYELYSAVRLALLARRATWPTWARAWIEALPSPRACGALLGASSLTVRRSPDSIVIEGEGPLGDPLLGLAELLCLRGAGRALEIWLRDLAEPEHARRTAALLGRAALELRARWEREPDLDLRALEIEALGPFGWSSPMDLRDEARAALRIARVEDLPLRLRSELGFTGALDECPWVLLEVEDWYAGGTRRHIAACAGDLPTVLVSSLLEATNNGGR